MVCSQCTNTTGTILTNLVKPRATVDENRAKELVGGIIRCSRDGVDVPEEWISEWSEIVARYSALKVAEASGNNGDSTDDESDGGGE